MLVSRLFRSLLRFLSPGIMPDEGGGTPAPVPDTPPAPVVDASPANPAPVATPAPVVAEPAAPMGGLRDLLDKVGSAPNGDPPPAPRVRDANGRFAPSDLAVPPATTAATPAAVAPIVPSAVTPPAAKPGEVDLTPPEGINERAQQRWSQLTERAKMVPQLEQRATQAETQLQSVRQLVQESGLAAQEFTDLLQIGRLFKAGDQQALQRLDAMRADLAMRLGVDVPGVDPLTKHPDLKADVDGMLMTRERALEIARLRQGNQQFQTATREQQDAAQFRQTVQSAAQSMEQTLRQREGTPGHDQKVAYIKQHLANPQNMQAFVARYQPQQWSSVVMMMYDAFQPMQTAPVAPVAPAVPQPLRPNNMRSGTAVAGKPASAYDAVQNAFASIGM